MRKIIKTTLIIALAITFAGLSYYFKDVNPSLLTGDVLSDMQDDPDDVDAIEFVTPKGSTTPKNGVVTIETVFVEFLAAGTNGNLSGSDLVNSPIFFVLDGTEPTGTMVDNNKIIIPEDTFAAFDVDICLSNTAGPCGSTNNGPSLTITPADCSGLKTSIMRGYGEGVYTGTDPLPTNSTSQAFRFDTISTEGTSASAQIAFDAFYTATRSLTKSGTCTDCKLVIENPNATGTTYGSKDFELTFIFDTVAVPDYAYDPVNCDMSDDSDCTITIKDTVVADGNYTNTLNRFEDAIDDLPYSPFAATFNAPSAVTLTATEKGLHTNGYTYTATLENTTDTYCSGVATGGPCNADPVCVEIIGPTCVEICSSLLDGTSCNASGECQWNDGTSTCDFKDPVTDAYLDDFTGGTASALDPVASIIISNSAPAEESGQQTFNIDMSFVSDLTERAKITSSTGSGDYEIDVRYEGDDTVGTASNFAYVFNDLLGINSPFFASIDPLNSSGIILSSRELGSHTNDYICNINGSPVNNCFAGATNGAVDITTVPLVLDNIMTQGDTALIYAGGSIGVTEWGSSHPSVLEIVPLGELSDGESGGTVDFISEPINPDIPSPAIVPADGGYNIDCETEWDDSDPQNIVSQECTVEFIIPVIYNPADDTFDTIVYIGSEDVQVPVDLQTGKLTGTLTGTGQYSFNTGLSTELTGKVYGVVSGNATDIAQGLVTGTISADVSASVSVPSGNNLEEGGFSLLVSVTPLAPGLLDEDGDFTSTVKLVDEESTMTNYAILYAKRDGTSILTVKDDMNCVATLDVDVLKKKVILQMVDKDPSDIFDPGETVQVNAYLGSAEMDVEEMRNITAESTITWESSNTNVATIDSTGVLTAVAPGTTNITATYYIGDAEIDPVESDPLTVKVNKITGLKIGLSESAQTAMPADLVEEAYENVLLIINEPQAAGNTVNVEGESIILEIPSALDADATDLEKIEAMAEELKNDINVISGTPVNAVITVDTPGMLILQPTSNDVNGYVDVTTTATTENVTILPTFDNTIALPASETYGLMVVAEYDNGRTKRLPTTDVTWVNTPLNYLDDALLESGLIALGDIVGTSTVVAQFENADATIINSNQLTIAIEAGPVISFVRRIGSGSITQGSLINLQAKVTDVDTIADIQEVSTSVIRSDETTYNGILGDADAVWFTAEVLEDDVEVLDEGGDETPVDSEGEGEGEGEGEEATAPSVNPGLKFRTYDIPVEIPVDQNMFDGNYKLLVSITDASNNTANYVLPIYIGELSSGDVSGDGAVTQVDVILAFQIASGTIIPTQAQLEAADINHMGGVTMVDVILLFNQAFSTTD